MSGRRVRNDRRVARWVKARPEKWHADLRQEPDSGNPTVRGRTRASGNAASWRRLHAARAPEFYLVNRMQRIEVAAGRNQRPSAMPRSARASRRSDRLHSYIAGTDRATVRCNVGPAANVQV